MGAAAILVDVSVFAYLLATLAAAFVAGIAFEKYRVNQRLRTSLGRSRPGRARTGPRPNPMGLRLITSRRP